MLGGVGCVDKFSMRFILSDEFVERCVGFELYPICLVFTSELNLSDERRDSSSDDQFDQ